MNQVLLYIGASMLTLVGIAHFAFSKVASKAYAHLSSELLNGWRFERMCVSLAIIIVGVTTLIILVMGDSDTETFRIAIISSTVFATSIALSGAILHRNTKVMTIKVARGLMIITAILYILGAIF